MNLLTPVSPLTGIEKFIADHYGYVAKAVRACFAVVGAMALQDRKRPLSLMLEASSGYGKTTALEMFLPEDAKSFLHKFVYRSDKFTPKSFVTHAANKTPEELAETDLLPKLKNKVFITKELAPIFRGRKDELTENFSVLITVLDGMGFVSDTGMHGRRGYEEKIMFNWLGATTPLTPEVHRMMAQLGTRLLSYEIPPNPPSDDDLTAYAMSEDKPAAAGLAQMYVREHLRKFFESHPVGSVPQADVTISPANGQTIARWAQFLASARAEVKCEKVKEDWTPVSAKPPEAPYKIVDYFKDLARGSALIDGRFAVEETDLEIVAEVAISSTPGHLRPIIRLLRKTGQADVVRCENACGVSRNTARRYMTELDLLHICHMEKGSPQTNEPGLITLEPRFAWLNESLDLTQSPESSAA